MWVRSIKKFDTSFNNSEYHTSLLKDMPRKSKKISNELVQPALAQIPFDGVSPAEALEEVQQGELIEIADMSPAWVAWGLSIYSAFQPFDELGDNAMAAIMAALLDALLAVGKIFIDFNFETNIGSIEHSGGTTFPYTVDEKGQVHWDGLVRCLTYGSKNPTGLNEHGCGLKTSLAILDPKNEIWEIWIKILVNSTLMYFRVKAPYSNKMRITRESSWPGKDTTAEPGSFIKFPINKEHFKCLYASKGAKMNDLKDLHSRIKCHFSHVWMKVPPYVNGGINIIYNGERILPFSFISPEVNEFVESMKKCEFELSTGAVIKLEEINLKPNARKILGSYTFKYAMEANGVYIFKNGREVEKVNGGELYKRFFGAAPDNHHNGRIVIINMTGKQEQLPPTVPTKNRFGISALFDEFIDLSSKHITPFAKREHISEEMDVITYRQRRENTLKTLDDKFTLEQEKTLSLSDTIRTPPIDLIETRGNNLSIMEFKATTVLRTEHIAQLAFNCMLASSSKEAENKTVKPVLVLRSMDDNKAAVSDMHKEYLRILSEKFNYKVSIRNTKDDVLYST